MAYEIEIPSSITVESNNTAVIELDNPTADIIDNQDRSVDVYSCTYVVVCDDIYIKNYIDEIPAWMQTYIENITNVALASTNTSLTNLINNFQALQDGYTATIASVTSDIATQNAVVDSLVTSTNDAIAGINTTLNTKIDQTQALALIAQEIATFRDFGLTEASAWWQAIINTVVTEQQAQATNISTLNSGLNNNSAAVNTVQSAVTTLDSAVAKASQYVIANIGGVNVITGFALVSSIDPNGDQISDFTINADSFRLLTLSGHANPFSVDGNNISFNGVVDFNSLVDGLGQTIIDGGLIKSEHLILDRLDANAVTIDQHIVSNDFNGNNIGNIGTPTQGFRLSSIAAGTDSDPTIYGAYIKSATLASTEIRVKDLIVLTDAGLDSATIIPLSFINGGMGFYSYNSTTGDGKRLASLNGNLLMCNGLSTYYSQPYLYYLGGVSLGGIDLGDSVVKTIDVRIVIGTTPVSETTIYQGIVGGLTQGTVNGITFGYKGGNIWIAFNSILEGFTGNGEVSFEFKSYDSYNQNVVVDWHKRTPEHATVFNI